MTVIPFWDLRWIFLSSLGYLIRITHRRSNYALESESEGKSAEILSINEKYENSIAELNARIEELSVVEEVLVVGWGWREIKKKIFGQKSKKNFRPKNFFHHPLFHNPKVPKMSKKSPSKKSANRQLN